MIEPTFDRHGYPTPETEESIRNWRMNDPKGWIEFIGKSWNHGYGRIWSEDGMVKFATGGWSGNESIVCAMKQSILWAMLWESSHRGGLEVLKNTYGAKKT